VDGTRAQGELLRGTGCPCGDGSQCLGAILVVASAGEGTGVDGSSVVGVRGVGVGVLGMVDWGGVKHGNVAMDRRHSSQESESSNGDEGLHIEYRKAGYSKQKMS